MSGPRRYERVVAAVVPAVIILAGVAVLLFDTSNRSHVWSGCAIIFLGIATGIGALLGARRRRAAR